VEVVKHETCLEYFRRRLSEGWKCISLEGYKAVLLSPEGIRRELDLRNDIETLRPNAAGDETNLYPNDTINWQMVDEAVADDDATTVECTAYPGWQRDLYNIQDHSVGNGTINSVTVYARCKTDASGVDGKIAIKSGTGGGAPNTIDESDITLTTSWADYSHTWATNPATASAWTWDEIDNLQIGINLESTGDPKFFKAKCTQIYVEVDYTPPGFKGSRGYIIG